MASQVEPPPFQEAARCDVCNCSFNTFRRRHHCRRCGRTLCHEHSSNQMALPQYGIYSSVRVCSDCFNNSSRIIKDDPPSPSAVDAAIDNMSKLDLDHTNVKTDMIIKNAVVDAPECKCGMPLCICEAPVPDPVPVQVQKATSSVQSNPRPRKNFVSQQATESNSSSSSGTKASLFFKTSQGSSDRVDKAQTNYECNGEGLREAIKNDDASAVKQLLSEGVDANYCDKQGLTLLHLAALFNRTGIAFLLMDHGADPEKKNAQGETPLDCAPTMLQNKMRKKIEG